MSKWPMVRFTDHVHVYQPETLAVKALDQAGNFPVFGANGRIGSHSAFNHECVELLLGCRGSVGSVNWSEPKSWINGNAMVVRPDPKVLDREFVAHLLAGGVDLSVAISGTAQPQITRTSLGLLMIPLPPLDEQKRIVAKLDEVAGRIQEMREALSGRREALGSLLEAQTMAIYGGVDARSVPLMDLVDEDSPITYGVVQPGPSGDIPLVRSGDLVGGQIQESQLRTISREVDAGFARTRLKGGEVLLALVGVPGASAVAPAFLAGANIARQVALIRPLPSVSAEYVCGWLTSRPGRTALQKVTQGSVQQVINLRDLREVRIPLPSLEEQESISLRVSSLKSLVAQGEQALAEEHHLLDLFDRAQLSYFLGESA